MVNRNKIICITLCAITLFFSSIETKGQKMEGLKDKMTGFAKGDKLPEVYSKYFLGQAYLSQLTHDKSLNCPIANVTFEPGCRNNWHTHSGGQILVVLEGRGFYQATGEKAKELHQGDVVEIPADVIHWHGAAPDSWFSHLAIETNPQTNKVTWLDPVNDEQYKLATGITDTNKSIKCNINSNAIKNHEVLFPNHKSTLQQTDPEFIAAFDNFAFDEVLNQSNLDVKKRVMLILASNIACQALTEYKVMLKAAFEVGVTPIEIKEIVYQAVPYLGIAKVFDFLLATNEFIQNAGIKLPLEGQSSTTPTNRLEKGLALQKEIFGSVIDDMYKKSPQDLMHIQHFLSANCFGDYLTRSGIDVKTRELLTFSMLISLGGAEDQVKGHIQGNLNIGNDRKVLIDAVTQLIPYIGYPRSLNAIKCINEIAK